MDNFYIRVHQLLCLLFAHVPLKTCKFKHLCLIHISFNKNCTLSILDVITINGSGSNQSNQRDFPKINRIETEMLTWFSSIFCTKFSPWISGVF